MMIQYDENSKMNIMKMPMVLFVIFAAITAVAVYMEKLPNSLIGGLAVCISLGYLLYFIIGKISILQKTIGMAAVPFICAFLVYKNLIPESAIEIVNNTINGKTDVLGFYVGALLCGSILVMDRKMLIKAGSRYFVPIAGGILVSYGVAGLVGRFFGYSFRDVVLYIVGPIMGGGNGAGAVPMSEIYANASGQAADTFYSKMLPAMTLGNWFAIFGGIILKNLGWKFPKLTGNGTLMKGYSEKDAGKTYDFTLRLEDLGIGCFATAAFVIFGRIIASYVPMIHAYAFTIIAVALVKILGILPERMEYCVVQWYQFMRANVTVIIMAGVGICMFDLASLFAVLSPGYVVMCLIVVAAATIGAGAAGMLMKFFFVEAGITAGLCMCNAGGNGDVYVLTAAERMELMSFAQISSRLGGAIILVIQSLLAGWLL